MLLDESNHTPMPQPASTHSGPASFARADVPTAAAPMPPMPPAPLEAFEWDGMKENLPTGNRKCMEYLRWYFFTVPDYSLQFKTGAEKGEYFKRKALVAEALAGLENILPLINFHRAVSDIERHANRPAFRAATLSKLESWLAANPPDSEAATPLNITTTNKLVCAAIQDGIDPDSKIFSFLPTLLCLARHRLATYATEFYRQWPNANPLDRIEEIRQELGAVGSLTSERIAELQGELSRLESSVGSEAITQAAHTMLINAFEPVREITINLLSELMRVLAAQKLDAVTDEKNFFAAHGVDPEPTTVSKRYDSAIGDCKAQLDRILHPQHTVSRIAPHPAQTPITGTFGLEVPGI